MTDLFLARCECTQHFMSVSTDPDTGGMWVQVTADVPDLRSRIREAWLALRGHRPCVAEVTLSRVDAERLMRESGSRCGGGETVDALTRLRGRAEAVLGERCYVLARLSDSGWAVDIYLSRGDEFAAGGNGDTAEDAADAAAVGLHPPRGQRGGGSSSLVES